MCTKNYSSYGQKNGVLFYAPQCITIITNKILAKFKKKTLQTNIRVNGLTLDV